MGTKVVLAIVATLPELCAMSAPNAANPGRTGDRRNIS
jgi:hypothetical protein